MNATRPPHIDLSFDDSLSDGGIPEETEAGALKEAQDLIRCDQDRPGKLAELQKLITEGLEIGVSDRTIDDVLKAARERAGLDNGKSRVG